MILTLLAASLAAPESITAVARLSPQGKNDYYVQQRAPLSPSPFQKLPTGQVKAKGWLLTQLQLQRDGFSGHLPEISRFLDPKGNAWLGATDNPRAGWEEVPYWLKGQISLAYTLDDKKLEGEVQPWIEGMIRSQQPDGWFGPEANRKTKLGTPDLWPNMLAQSVLQTYYEATGDKRVITLMTKYVDYLDSLSEKETVDPRHYWHYHRVGDQLASLVWLYDQTGDPKIFKVAEKLHRHSSDWTDGIANVHGVNFAQGFREPALDSLFSHSDKELKATEKDLMAFTGEYGQMPGGMYGADENARKGKTDPRQAAESCAIVEMMLSDELLLQTTGNPVWADRAEDTTFNWMPTTMTPDLKALRYLTAGNMAVSDAPSKSPGIENGGPMFLMDPWDHRCCQHNIGHGWPYFTEHLWMATNGNGLAAVLYAPATVTAKVGDGTKTTIETATTYPFGDTLTFKVSPAKSVRFPLSLRIPAWCRSPQLSIDGKARSIKAVPGGFITIDRTWAKGDSVTLKLPMAVRTESWSERPGTLSVYRGPLAYSLKIEEETKRYGRTDAWPSYEILPKSAWNYGLEPNPKFEVHISAPAAGQQPWDYENVPVSLVTTGRKIPEWGLDMYGLVAPLQPSPAQTLAPAEKLTLIPMGAARLRITVFPTVTTNGGHTWIKPQAPVKPIPATYSYRNWWDSESALSDHLLPKDSNDEDIPRFTWWDHKGTEEWVQYNFPANRTFQKCRVFWFDDAPKGGCRVPASWKLQVKVGDKWQDVEADGAYPVAKNEFNEVTFRPIGGQQIRLVAQLQKGFSGGILEWEVN